MTRMGIVCCVQLVWLYLASLASSQMALCPFDYMYHFGDGVTDVGNSILIQPWGPNLPSAKPPYGMTYPGYPTGRWSDGLIDFDFAAADIGFPVVTPYLSGNVTDNNVIIFSVARSPVLEHEFFEEIGVKIPPFVVSIKGQARWFKQYLEQVCSTPQECADRLGRSIIFFGDIEGNDIGYALSQGKSIEEVMTYVPFIVEAQIDVARDMIQMGAKTLVIAGNSLMGCYPYLLEALQSDDPEEYDEYGCLKRVNDFIDWKNDRLNQSVQLLQAEFTELNLLYSPFSTGFRAYLQQYVAPNGTVTLKSCCGGGGKYNFNEEKLCGSIGAEVCSNPSEYLFWDGYHFTEDAYHRIEQILIPALFTTFNCTVLDPAAAGSIRPAISVM